MTEVDQRSNVVRFPTIGRHLIHEATPAFAPTDPEFMDTEPLTGSSDALGDDNAERHSGWGYLPECAPECGQIHPSQPSTVHRPGLLQRLLRWLSTT